MSDRKREEFVRILRESSMRCTSANIALSGGLDSCAIAYCMRERRPEAYAAVADGFAAPDLPYSQMAAAGFGLRLNVVRAGMAEIASGVEDTIKILGNFNDIEIRNSLVMYITLRALVERGQDSVITGDGADEIFAGYSFMVRKPPGELGAELDRMRRVMHFPSVEIGRRLGVVVETPFLDPQMVEFAGSLTAEDMVGTRRSTRHGKVMIRDALAGSVPDRIVWRQKTPMQDGAGTAGLSELFEFIIPDESFARMRDRILESDGVRIRTKESLHYYRVFRRIFGRPRAGGSSNHACGDCCCPIEAGSRFCRMCGKFPA